jgi:hypothetical protein
MYNSGQPYKRQILCSCTFSLCLHTLCSDLLSLLCCLVPLQVSMGHVGEFAFILLSMAAQLKIVTSQVCVCVFVCVRVCVCVCVCNRSACVTLCHFSVMSHSTHQHIRARTHTHTNTHTYTHTRTHTHSHTHKHTHRRFV